MSSSKTSSASKPFGANHFSCDFSVAELLDHLRTLTLRHDELGQEIILNEILRKLVLRKDFEHAEKLIANSQLKQPYRSPNQAARFSYYVGLTNAICLDYTAANANIIQALRKAPERALGFRIAATKLHLTVQLLLGEIPPRADFLEPTMKEALYPYMLLATCVRFGNLGRFISLLKQHQSTLEHDNTYTLFVRVRHNVIKTGLMRICQAYSRISFSDICMKLALENPDDAEYIVSKAIRNGVIDATIDHSAGIVNTSDTVDVYNTTEPAVALQKRIAFLNATHEEAVRAMRYVGNVDPELDEERRRKTQAELDALAKEMEGGNLEDDPFMEL